MGFYDILLAKKLSGNGGGGGGGASNIVTGEFHTDTTSGVMTIDIPYNGNGYIVGVYIGVEKGTSGADTHWDTTVAQYAVGLISVYKNVQDTAPLYTGSSDDKSTVIALYKSSASNASTLKAIGEGSTTIYSQYAPSGSGINNVVKIPDKTHVKVLVGNQYSLLADTDYAYIIVYSE